ncbi:PepSY-associated TM region [Limimonas halophila]|uniref:PepSY-associated TM region n=1 Tax=Limimonas halophila TaxID=1082479 RepID=A0A1G7M9B0_9PROT|nr:PepSY domain-containing protein [Limimonas halophila]SDF58311.1 PepSY-associated TM region [Limimonas halophila]
MARADRRRKRLRAWNLKLHRWVGLAAGAVLVLLAVTGVLINHSPTLGLDDAELHRGWLLRLYHDDAAARTRAYRVDGRWLGWAGGTLVLDGERVTDIAGPPVGAVASARVLVAAGSTSLVLLTPDGRLVESLGAAALPGEPTALARAKDGGVVLRTANGCHRAGPGVVSWSETSCPDTWSQPGEPPAEVRARLAELAGRPHIPWSRLLLDLHSGRLFGTAGVLVVDLVGLAAVALAITGLTNWLGGRAPRRKRRS